MIKLLDTAAIGGLGFLLGLMTGMTLGMLCMVSLPERPKKIKTRKVKL